jgi:hypothetical protein
MSRNLTVLSLVAVTMISAWAPAQNVAPSTLPATRPLTKTVGVDIVKMTANPDKTVTLLFRWKDRQQNDVERSVILNDNTVIGINGELKTIADLTPELISRNKAVATVGPDEVTAVSLRVGRAMIRVARNQLTPAQVAALEAAAPKATEASNAAMTRRVNEMVEALHLNDPARESRVKAVITEHLREVRDSHNAGFAPDKASLPKFVAGLNAELTPEQVESIKDAITIGKVEFTRRAYHAIVKDLTPAEDAKILALLKQAREESLDLKNPDEMSVVFEKYKTQIERYLISNGRDWRKLYREFIDAQRAANRPSTRPAADTN